MRNTVSPPDHRLFAASLVAHLSNCIIAFYLVWMVLYINTYKGCFIMVTVSSPAQVKVADEVWIVAALLHKENPDRSDFSMEEIMDRARREKLTDLLRPGFYVHVIQ